MGGRPAMSAGLPAPADPAAPYPFGLSLQLDGALHRSGQRGTILAGGQPRRVMRLAPAGGAALDELLVRGAATAAEARLARALTDAGVAHPSVRATADGPPAATVLIPVRDRPAALARCLASLGGRWPVIVVDDGSAQPAQTRRIAAAAGATVLRRPVSGGPAAARNRGLQEVRTPFAILLDSDCLAPANLELLLEHFRDPLVAAVGARVHSVPASGRLIDRYGAARSPLDLGREPARVVPGTRVSYVPTAALAVRTEAVGEGFDPALRFGEDVDLVWRLADAGWRVRYEPAVVAGHTEPAGWGALLRRRFDYGTSAGPLARRHGRRLAPLVLRPLPAGAALLALTGRRRTALLAVSGQAALLARTLARAGGPPVLGARWGVASVADTLDGIARSLVIFALPAALATGVRRPRRRATVAWLLGSTLLRSWWREGRSIDPLRWAIASSLDDAAYGAGVWVGAVRARAIDAVLPRLGKQR